MKIKAIHPETKQEQCFPSLICSVSFKVHHRRRKVKITMQTILNGF
jgi:hypothetical protein